MKILVFSDSHGRSINIKTALELHKSDTEAVIFLGDGVNDAYLLKEQYPSIPFFIVRGNCDFYCPGVEDVKVINLDGIKVLITHGHMYSAKSTKSILAEKAFEYDADAVFFGHTHVPFDDIWDIEDKRIHLFNPGSIGYEGYYGIINTSKGVIVTSHGKIC